MQLTSALAGRRIGRRLIHLVLVLLGTTVLNFVLLKLMPGDLVDVIASESGNVSPQFVAQLREAYGLDHNVAWQLLHYVGHALRLDLGFSFRFGEPVSALIFGRLPATLALIGTALVVSVSLGMLLGVLAARRPHGVVDTLVSSLATIGYSAPMFWTALMLIVIFGVHLEWLPIGGVVDTNVAHHGAALLLDRLRHLVLPAATLVLYYVAIFARLARASMIETLQEDFIRTARAKGGRPWYVVTHHALRHALLPVLTMLGLQGSALIGGSVIVETVFGWPGLGQLSFEAIKSRDVNLLVGVLLFSAVLVVALNLIVDLLYGLVDPRTRYRR
ncbi:binding-protein-dependent transport system inner membrane protein [Caballeronia arationis]|uniref:ABC-type dipeptide/oligopeptide/nickel transport system, permease component n=1 Tax=Caballeronia arationis TaxID=1777142 RepID=A0A7Z7I2T5_9BURK|nr:ABC transporter permease [Caballeronia arationis]SAL05805.1 binding-protein-dependent transport system inner membrane protein [Caballeronia arationis]SOE53211.1 ABC-type dipeptide/oligopeptide/nickel transport system, permease component [Caballeronia arationis]